MISTRPDGKDLLSDKISAGHQGKHAHHHTKDDALSFGIPKGSKTSANNSRVNTPINLLQNLAQKETRSQTRAHQQRIAMIKTVGTTEISGASQDQQRPHMKVGSALI